VSVRTYVYRIELSTRHVREGDVLRLHLGSGGRILAAFAGEPCGTIRGTYHYISLDDRNPDTAGLSAQVFGPGAILVGAITLAGPRIHIDETFIARMKRPPAPSASR
jgi:DNA-binding IclR family transcriptional regulator